MEGYLGLKLRPAFRRLITRLLAIIPALVVSLSAGENGVNSLLILSQVILSLTLPFAIIPLVYFTNSKKYMSSKTSPGSNTYDVDNHDSDTDDGAVAIMDDRFVNGWVMCIVSWTIVVVISVLNIYLVVTSIFGIGEE